MRAYVLQRSRALPSGAAISAAVIVFPGSNCDRDCKVAVERSSGERVEMVRHQETELMSGLT